MTVEISTCASPDCSRWPGSIRCTPWWTYAGSTGAVEYALPLPTDPSRKRVALRLPVRGLLPALGRLDAGGRLAVDHIYDY
jgi:hypothetical protein